MSGRISTLAWWARTRAPMLRVTVMISALSQLSGGAEASSTTSEYYGRATAQGSSEAFSIRLWAFHIAQAYSTLEPGLAAKKKPDTGERTKIDWQRALKFTRPTRCAGRRTRGIRSSEPISAANNIDSGLRRFSPGCWKACTLLSTRVTTRTIRFGGKVTYRVAPAYTIPGTGMKLKASVARGSRRPRSASCSRAFRTSFSSPIRISGPRPAPLRPGGGTGARRSNIEGGVTYYSNRFAI